LAKMEAKRMEEEEEKEVTSQYEGTQSPKQGGQTDILIPNH